jgi:hypothetical protein
MSDFQATPLSSAASPRIAQNEQPSRWDANDCQDVFGSIRDYYDDMNNSSVPNYTEGLDQGDQGFVQSDIFDLVNQYNQNGCEEKVRNAGFSGNDETIAHIVGSAVINLIDVAGAYTDDMRGMPIEIEEWAEDVGLMTGREFTEGVGELMDFGQHIMNSVGGTYREP